MKCKYLQTGHSAFFKKKSQAIKCKNRILKNEPNQTKLRIKKTNHTIRGKGWLVEA